MNNLFTVNKSKEAVKDGGSGSSFMTKSGIYDVTIKFASVDVSKNGAKSVNFNFDLGNGQTQTIYGPYITDKEGNPLDIGLGLVRDKLGVIAGADSLDIEDETHNVGKDNKPQEFAVITNFSDLPVKVRIQMEYSIYNGEIKERKVIRNFFREDGASAEEIIAIDNGEEAEIGKRLAYETEKLANNNTYKDGLTEEDVAKWLADKAANKSTPAKAAPATNSSAKSKLFK